MSRRLTEIEAIKRPTRLGDEVYNTVYALLVSHKIPPGGRISIDSLARDLGVSQTPVREALSRMEAQGLVVKAHLIGYSAASPMDSDRFRQLYEFRLLLEPFAASRAAINMPDDSIDTLERLEATMQQSDTDSSRVAFGRFTQSNSEYHNLIASESGNELLQETLARLHTHLHLFRVLDPVRTATSQANVEHTLITRAIRARDPEAAADAMRKHIERSLQRFEKVYGS